MTVPTVVRLHHLLSALDGHDWISASEVADVLGVKVNFVAGQLADAARDGLLERKHERDHNGDVRPFYRLNERGRAEMGAWK